MRFIQWVWVCIQLVYSSAFSPTKRMRKYYTSSSRYAHNYHNDNYEDVCNERRDFVLQTASSIIVGLVVSHPANADTTSATSLADTTSATAFEPSAVVIDGNYNCLLDLPPITPGCVRVYLCRHGQTENNRLKLVQGARIDPSINANGQEQAYRLGLAISKLEGSSEPHLALHSKLKRARETADIVASTVSSSQSTTTESNKQPTIQTREVACLGKVDFCTDDDAKYHRLEQSLGEVDFGQLEGIDVKTFHKTIRRVYARWTIGDIDTRAGGGGESGREVLLRAGQALEELSQIAANTSSSSILAVSHSTYLRILLSLVNDSPLAEAVLWKVRNGAANVVDINIEGKRRLVTSNSGIFGGAIIGRLRGDNTLQIDIPETHLIRRNEVRHLEGMMDV